MKFKSQPQSKISQKILKSWLKSQKAKESNQNVFPSHKLQSKRTFGTVSATYAPADQVHQPFPVIILILQYHISILSIIPSQNPATGMDDY